MVSFGQASLQHASYLRGYRSITFIIVQFDSRRTDNVCHAINDTRTSSATFLLRPLSLPSPLRPRLTCPYLCTTRQYPQALDGTALQHCQRSADEKTGSSVGYQHRDATLAECEQGTLLSCEYVPWTLFSTHNAVLNPHSLNAYVLFFSMWFPVRETYLYWCMWGNFCLNI